MGHVIKFRLQVNETIFNVTYRHFSLCYFLGAFFYNSYTNYLALLVKVNNVPKKVKVP